MKDPYSRDSGILHNNFDTDNLAYLNALERDLSAQRIGEIARDVDSPDKTFDRKHLEAIHHKIFQDTYPWAGKTRDQTFEIDNVKYTPIDIAKDESQFLQHSKIDIGIHEALKPLKENTNLEDINNFSEKAGEILDGLNFVHAFREGNGRANRSFISTLGRAHGHDVDFTVITQFRNTQASISVFNNPDSDEFKELILDATDPTRREALRDGFKAIEENGYDPQEFNIRSARVGETIEGSILKHDKETFTFVSAENTEIVVIDKLDLPKDYDKKLAGDDIKINVENDLSNLQTDERLLEVAKQDALKELQNSQNAIRGDDDLER